MDHPAKSGEATVLPWLSIVVPVYNRAGLVRRCLDSVLAQHCDGVELIAVDDGSTDGSWETIQAYAGSGCRPLRHPINRGVGAARNTGGRAATGAWLIFLDSDDELVPGALQRIRELTQGAPSGVQALWFRSRMDDGRLCPADLPTPARWDYEGYCRFLQQTIHHPRDMLRCLRRPCFDALQYPEDRMLEAKYHLDFARRFETLAMPDVLRLYHQDASDRLAQHVKGLDRLRGKARHTPVEAAILRDAATGYVLLLQEHGPALRRFAPSIYRQYLRRAAVCALHSDRHREALDHALRLVLFRPVSGTGWKILLLALRQQGQAGLRTQTTTMEPLE